MHHNIVILNVVKDLCPAQRGRACPERSRRGLARSFDELALGRVE